MSTRAVITFVDEFKKYAVYRHNDGYPEGQHGVIADIKEALKFAWPLPRFEADEFATAFIRASKDGPGNIYLTTRASAHGDLDYEYEVSVTGLFLKVNVFTSRPKKFHSGEIIK